MRCSILLIAAATAAADARADVSTVAWPATVPGGAGPFTGCTVARLSGDGRADVVLASDGQVVVADALDHFSAFRLVAIGGTALDVATLPADGVVPADDRDRVVIAASSGLWTLRETAQGDVVAAIDTSPAWCGARRVVVADLDGDGDDDVVALLANGRTIDAKLQGPGGAWSDSAAFETTALQEVLDFAVAELDGDLSHPELVVNERRALRLFAAGPSLLASFPSLRPDHERIAVARDARPAGGDAIAWITAASAAAGDPARHLFLVTVEGATWCATTFDALGPAVSGRFTAGTDADLAFLRAGESELVVLEQQEGTPPFDFAPEHGFTVELGGSAAAAAARPCVGDLGDDGQDEIVAPLGSIEAIAIVSAPIDLTATLVPDFVHDATCSDKLAFEVTDPEVRFVATYPNAWQLAATGWQVDYVIWRQEIFDGPFAPGFVQSCRVPLATLLVAPGGDEIEVAFDCPNDLELYYVQVRPIKLAPGGGIEKQPALFGAFSANMANFELIDAAGLGGVPGWPENDEVFFCAAGGGAPSPPRVAGFIRIRRMPPSAPPAPPVPAGPCSPPN